MVEPCGTLEIHPEKIELVRKRIEESDTLQLAEFFKLLSGETRIKILLALLSKEELCVCDLSEILEMSVSAVSHQLRELRQGRFVKFRREGKEVYYHLEVPHLEPILKLTLEHLQESE